MKKILLFFVLIACCSPAFAGNWYAQGGTCNMSACTWNSKGNGSGSTLTWASRAAGDNFYANAQTAIAVDVDPGVGGSNVTLRTDANAGDGGAAGGGFTLATATCAGFSGGIAHIDRIAGTTSALTVTGTTANCILSGLSTGGSSSGAAGTTDNHTAVAITLTNCLLTGGSGTSSTFGYNWASNTGSVDASACNALGGATAAGFSNSGNGTSTIKNCVGSDTSGGSYGCTAATTSTGGLTVKGSLIYGKFNTAAFGRVFLAPSSTASAIYAGTNTSYASTDIVDASGNVLGSPTLTNAFVAPMAFVSSGIGTVGNVKSGIVYGPYTGTASAGTNSGSAN